MNKQSLKVAIIGATGSVGATLVRILDESDWQFQQLDLYAQYEYPVYFRNQTIFTKSLSKANLKGMDFVFSAAGSKVANEILSMIDDETWLIDKTSAFRMYDSVPLIVPELNANDISKALTGEKRIISCPNCVAIPLSMCLKPILEMSDITKCVVSTYQSVSGAGRDALQALSREQKDFDLDMEDDPKFFKKHIAMNVIPHVDQMYDDMWTSEEIKIMQETKKILAPLANNMLIDITCVRIPITVCHSASVHLTLANNIALDEMINNMRKIPGLFVIEGKDRYITPKEATGEDICFVNRVRKHRDDPKQVSFWFTCDNLRKGAALNAFQIAEYIIDNDIK